MKKKKILSLDKVVSTLNQVQKSKRIDMSFLCARLQVSKGTMRAVLNEGLDTDKLFRTRDVNKVFWYTSDYAKSNNIKGNVVREFESQTELVESLYLHRYKRVNELWASRVSG